MDKNFFKIVPLGGFDKKEVLNYINQIDCDNKVQIKNEKKKLEEITLMFEDVNNDNKKLQEEILKLKTENKRILTEKNNLINETNKIVEESKIFKDKYDDIAIILLDIETKRKVTMEETEMQREGIINKAKQESEKIINNVRQVSKKMVREGEIKYEQTIEASIELVNLIDNSRKIFNRISDETMELIKNSNKEKI